MVAHGSATSDHRRGNGDGAAAAPSILFHARDGVPVLDGATEPSFFADLNLDQVVAAITTGFDEYDLEPYFHTLLRTEDEIDYRHEVLQDLERGSLLESVRSFAKRMRTMREQLSYAQERRYRYEQERWHLDATRTYCDAVGQLLDDLDSAELRSRGFESLRAHLRSYCRGESFRTFVAESNGLDRELSDIEYTVHIKGNRVKVSRHDDEIDYSTEVLRTFERFKQGTVKDHRVGVRTFADLDQVEARILDEVAKLNPDVFARLDRFCDRYRDSFDPVVTRFDREVEFYVAFLRLVEPLRTAGLTFTYPGVSTRDEQVYAYDTFDVALANTLVPRGSTVVCNDIELTNPERILVVSGPNQGGKTTYARTFGQVHYLAAIGCLVPGREAKLTLFDEMFTHFESEEDPSALHGKLEDDLLRIEQILQKSTPDSIVILNEIFTSTAMSDALFLSEKVLERIVALDLLCVCVTFLDELASLGPTTVSIVSTVDPDDPAVRTFKLARRPADGLAYAAAIADKYGLTYAGLKGRLAS